MIPEAFGSPPLNLPPGVRIIFCLRMELFDLFKWSSFAVLFKSVGLPPDEIKSSRMFLLNNSLLWFGLLLKAVSSVGENIWVLSYLVWSSTEESLKSLFLFEVAFGSTKPPPIIVNSSSSVWSRSFLPYFYNTSLVTSMRSSRFWSSSLSVN